MHFYSMAVLSYSLALRSVVYSLPILRGGLEGAPFATADLEFHIRLMMKSVTLPDGRNQEFRLHRLPHEPG